MQRQTSLLLLLCLFGYSMANEDFSASDYEKEEAESRIFFNNNGNFFIALNTTQLYLFLALAGLGLLGALALSSLFSSNDETGYGYSQQHSSGYNKGGQQGGYHHGYRQKRSSQEGIYNGHPCIGINFIKIGCNVWIGILGPFVTVWRT